VTASSPTTLAEALAARAARPDATVVAGGTDLLPALRTGRLAEPAAWLALHAVDELSGIVPVRTETSAKRVGFLHRNNRCGKPTRGARLRIGAGTTIATVETEPLIAQHAAALRDAAALIGGPATRTVATVGGNLVNGSPAMELGAPLLALGATVELASRAPGGGAAGGGAAGGGADAAAGTAAAAESPAVVLRRLPLADFLLGPGRVDLRPDELLVAVELDVPPAGSAYARIDGRAAVEVALAGAAAAVELTDDGATVAQARIALCAVAPTCRRAPAAERLLAGRRPTAALLDAVAQEAAAAAAPIGDHRAPADYRRAGVAVAVRRALDAALAAARREPADPDGEAR